MLKLSYPREKEALNVTSFPQIGRFLQHATETQLNGFPADVRVSAITNIGKSSLKKLAKSALKTLKKFAVRNIRRTAGAAPQDRSAAGELDEIDLANMAAIKCGLEDTDIDKLTVKAIRNHMADLARCPWARAQRKRLIARAKAAIA